MPKKKGLVVVGMSGGVDSSVTALLLKKQGYDVVGVFMRCYNVDGCAERDAEDARRVAGHLDIPFYAWDFEEEYKKRVVSYMVEGYWLGLTPNPDVMCNREIKFGLFFEKAMAFGADYVATGHYARIIRGEGNVQMFEAKDKNKDQSYFLWTLTQKQLRHCLFPIGEYLKSDVRVIAKKAGLSTAEKKDSQGICFLGKVTISDFLKQYIPAKKGVVVSVDGEKIGEHDGAYFYTIGQRQGIGNMKHEKGNKIHVPLYVTGKDVKTNTITVAPGANHEALYEKELRLGGVSFLSREIVREEVFARVRYRQPLSSAILHNPKSNTYNLIFDEPQKFIAPGQSAVFYSAKGGNSSIGRQVLGGGIIL